MDPVRGRGNAPALDTPALQEEAVGEMWKALRIALPILIAVLLIGTVWGGARASEAAIAPSVSISADHTMAACAGCDSGSEAALVCASSYFSNCGSAVAFLPAPAEVPRNGSVVAMMGFGRWPANSGVAPDPFPPKNTVLI